MKVVRWKTDLTVHPEWQELAKKQMKGKDPQEHLMWRTQEVMHPTACDDHNNTWNMSYAYVNDNQMLIK